MKGDTGDRLQLWKQNHPFIDILDTRKYVRHSVRASRCNRLLGGPWPSREIVGGWAGSLRECQMTTTVFSPHTSSVINSLKMSSKTGLIYLVQEVPLGPVTL